MSNSRQAALRVLFVSGCAGDTQRYRCYHPAEQLRLLGHVADVCWHTDPGALDVAAKADLIVLQRPVQTHYLDALVEVADGRPLVYETDDLIFDPTLAEQIPIVHQNRGLIQQQWRNYVFGNARTLDYCSAALTSTTTLAERLNTSNRRVWLQRNGLGNEQLSRSAEARATRSKQRPPTIGYFSGTCSHDQDFAAIAPALVRILKQHRSARLLIGGCLNLPSQLDAFEQQIERHPFVPWQALPALMAQVDVLLAPLDLQSPFAQCRSELKYLEAAAIGVPIVAAPIPAFVQAIRPAETGFLAETIDDWHSALEQLLHDPNLAQAVGDAAYEHVRTDYTFEALAPQLERSLREIMALAEEPGSEHRTLSFGYPDYKAVHQLLPTQTKTPNDQNGKLQTLEQRWQADLKLHGRTIYMLTGCDIANSGAYRCYHRQQQLELHDIRSVAVSQMEDGFVVPEAVQLDIGILHRVAYDEAVGLYIELMHARGHPVLFDTDDLVFRPELIGHVDAIKDWPEDQKAQYREGVERYQQTLLACGAAIVSTEPLAQQVRELGQRAFVVRNALRWEQIERAEPLAEARLTAPLPASTDLVTIGYFSGTATHNRDFAQAAPALLRLLAEAPNVRLRIVGPLELAPAFEAFADSIERRPLVSLVELAAEVAAVDVALAPLELDNPYCQAKSEVKYMEAGIVGVPVIATPTEAFRVAITDGVTGLLAATSDEWLDALRAFAADPGLRRRLGEAARKDVLLRYTPAARSRELLDVLDAVWEEQSAFRQTVSPNASLIRSTELYIELLERYRNTVHTLGLTEAMLRMSQIEVHELRHELTKLEGHHQQVVNQLQVVQTEASTLRQLLDQISQGRLMRFLNAATAWRRR